jgi:hypothetical protein
VELHFDRHLLETNVIRRLGLWNEASNAAKTGP